MEVVLSGARHFILCGIVYIVISVVSYDIGVTLISLC